MGQGSFASGFFLRFFQIYSSTLSPDQSKWKSTTKSITSPITIIIQFVFRFADFNLLHLHHDAHSQQGLQFPFRFLSLFLIFFWRGNESYNYTTVILLLLPPSLVLPVLLLVLRSMQNTSTQLTSSFRGCCSLALLSFKPARTNNTRPDLLLREKKRRWVTINKCDNGIGNCVR